MRLTLIILSLSLFACVPQSSGASDPVDEAANESVAAARQPVRGDLSFLEDQTLTVPGTEVNIALTPQMLEGELAAFKIGEEKGTLRLMSAGLSVDKDEGSFHVVPIEILRVSGTGGLYLLLLEQSPNALIQHDAVLLGRNLSLLSLSVQDDLISAATVDAGLGRFPATEVRGNVAEFRLEDEQLINVD